jgi:hypothetical protein
MGPTQTGSEAADAISMFKGQRKIIQNITRLVMFIGPDFGDGCAINLVKSKS